MSLRHPIVVFADADGVFTSPAGPACANAARILRQLDDERVPLVLCSRRTRAEIEQVRQDFGLHHPFVIEGGGAAFIPAGYFSFDVPGARAVAGYQAVEFGRPYAEVVRALRHIAARQRVSVLGFSEMSVEDVARDCDLPLLQARLAKLREYGERFRVLDPGGARRRLVRALEAARLRCVMGDRYDQVGAGVDTGLAIGLLQALYTRALGPLWSVGADEITGGRSRPFPARDGVGVNRAARTGDGIVGWAEAVVDAVRAIRGGPLTPAG